MENFLHLGSTVSTNKDAYELALNGAAHGSAVLADVQTGGRGRMGRVWVSPPGSGLYCSIILRPKLPFPKFPSLTLTAGLALCISIEKLTDNMAFGLKWPNDLYCRGRKCGGILVESSTPSVKTEDSFVVVGIGVNVNSRLNDFPLDLQESVSSLRIENQTTFNIRELFFLIRNSLFENLRIHEESGFAAIINEWRKRDLLYGKEMQWLTTDKQVITGIGLGPDETGQLVAKDKEGMLHVILSGDVTLR
jgi:BirA family biotin operon repressor/biotin-[acetyl-CoA-carboxylase] ligase